VEEPAHDLSDGEMSESCVPHHHHHHENDTVHVNMVQATRQNTIILLESVHYPGRDAPRIKSGKQ
jgi:acetaldehyde dehydrogenase (acetylating)